jgi:hypothetical protein
MRLGFFFGGNSFADASTEESDRAAIPIPVVSRNFLLL